MRRIIIFIFLIVPVCKSVSDWQPILEPELYPNIKSDYSPEPSFPSLPSLVAQSYQQPSLTHAGGGHCELYKVGFTQDLYFQYIQYKVSLPELKEFTLCYWSKFTNHSNDHPILSYAVDGQPRALFAWVSNTERSSYYSLAINGHTFYRLNYPLRLNRWYHTCQSWNGKTGEWQIWVNAERVGRGFYNALAGHHIPAGGIAITGQQQTQYGGGFLEGDEAPKGAGGMLGEITMVQLYSVALTAGKAHRDHKHHHAHTFDHNGVPITTTPRPTRPPRPLTPTHPLLTGGQLNPNIALTIASAQTQQQFQPRLVPGQNYNIQFLNGQFVSNLPLQRLMNSPQSRGPHQFLPQDPSQLPPQGPPPPIRFFPPTRPPGPPIPPQTPDFRLSSLINAGLAHPSLINPANVQFIDSQLETHQLFKRDNKNDTTQRAEEDTNESESESESKSQKSSLNPVSSSEDSEERKHSKRELFLDDGTILDDGAFQTSFQQSLLSGLAGIGDNQPILQKQKQYDEREPAEAEVMAVMNLCSGCDQEPFEKAVVFEWRSVPKNYTPVLFTYRPRRNVRPFNDHVHLRINNIISLAIVQY